MRRTAVLWYLLLAAGLLAGCGLRGAERSAPVQAAPETPTEAGPKAAAPEAPPEPSPGLPDWARAYFEQVLVQEAEAPETEYALVDFAGGEVPALMAGRTGYWVSLYQYGGGSLHVLLDACGYGAMGNHGYEYLPGRGVVRNYNTDLAGAILYTSYGLLTDEGTLDGYTLSLWNFDDRDGDYEIDEDEGYGEVCRLFLCGQEDRALTPAEYDGYTIEGDYAALSGGKPCRDFLEELNRVQRTRSDQCD